MQHTLKKALFAGAALAVLGAGPVRAETDLTVVSWGGAYSESQERAYVQPYMEEHPDIKIQMDDQSANALAGIRSQAEAGNITWDLVDMLQGDAQLACDEGLLVEINPDDDLAAAPDGTPAAEDFIEGTMGECFVPQILYATLFAYNTEAFPDGGPQTIADVWDIEKFPGKRGLQRIPDGNLEWALMADGVPADEVYDVLSTDEGVDRAFAKLDELKGNVVWWSEGAQPPQLLADKEVAMATGYNGRFFNAQVNENQPIELMWDGQYFEVDGWVVPAGGPNEQAVMEFLKWATDTQRLADQAKFISYAPARESSVPLVGKHADTGVEMGPHMPTSPENFKNPLQKDPIWWADNGDEMRERFNAWLAQG
ncbi:MAG: ABC transporter substrate-binding protein [Geminicoccaceae bacterium]|nr:ABC transporter substrate-binding protein [Geminicoccaceae bacterium]